MLAAKEPTIANSTCSNTRAQSRGACDKLRVLCALPNSRHFVLAAAQPASTSASLQGAPCTYLLTRFREGGGRAGEGEIGRGSEKGKIGGTLLEEGETPVLL
jgi:hypothetical protein